MLQMLLLSLDDYVDSMAGGGLFLSTHGKTQQHHRFPQSLFKVSGVQFDYRKGKRCFAMNENKLPHEPGKQHEPGMMPPPVHDGKMPPQPPHEPGKPQNGKMPPPPHDGKMPPHEAGKPHDGKMPPPPPHEGGKPHDGKTPPHDGKGLHDVKGPHENKQPPHK